MRAHGEGTVCGVAWCVLRVLRVPFTQLVALAWVQNVQRYPTARLFSFRSEDKAHEFNGMGKELLLPPSNMPHWHILSVVKDVFGVAFSRELSAGEPGGDANADEDLDGDVALDVDAFADVQGGDDAM